MWTAADPQRRRRNISCKRPLPATRRRNEMKTASKILLAGALVSCFAAPVLAAENEDTQGMIYEFLNGKMYKAHVGADTMRGMMSHFRRLRNGTMIYSNGGHFYIAE